MAAVSNKLVFPILLFFTALVFLLYALQPQLLEVKLVVLIMFPGIAFALASLPLEKSLFLFFLYVGVEGAAKLISRYSPIIHVGSDMIVGLLVMKVVFEAIFYRREVPHRLPFLVKLLVVHLLWFLMVFFNPYAVSIAASLAATKIYVTPALLFLFGLGLCKDHEKLAYFTRPWIAITFVHMVLSIYQGMIGPASVTRWSPMYEIVLERFKGYPFRPFGLTSNPGGPAVYTYVVVALLMCAFVRTRGFLVKVFVPVTVVLMGLVLVLCQVKSAIIKFLLAMVLFLVALVIRVGRLEARMRRNTVLFLVASGVLIVATVPFAVKTLTESYAENNAAIMRSFMAFNTKAMVAARSGAWDRFWTYAERAPLGSGLSRIGPAVYRFADEIQESGYFRDVFFFSDNLWVQLVVDLGLPGSALVTLFVISVFIVGLQVIWKAESNDEFLVASAVYISLLMIMMGSYGAEPILYNPEAAFFWFFAGGIARLADKELKLSGDMR